MRGTLVLRTGLLAVVLAGTAIFLAPRVCAQAPGRPDTQVGAAILPLAPPGGRIGVSVRNVGAEDVKALKLAAQSGAVIENVEPDSPAGKAGLRVNDVVVEFDGERVRSARQLTRLVLETPPGLHVKVGVMRDGRRTDLEVTPAENRPGPIFRGEDLSRALEGLGELGRNLDLERFRFRLPPGAGMAARPGRLGVNVQELSGDLFSYFSVKNGVLVSSVVNDSPAARAGLKAGDVITAVDSRPVATVGQLVEALGDPGAAREVTLSVVRDRKDLTLKAKLEAAGAPTPAPRRGPA